MPRFNEILKDLRTAKNLTQEELSKELGFKSNRINYFESRNGKPSIKDSIKIASYFNVSIDYLYGNLEQRLNGSFISQREREIIDMILSIKDLNLKNDIYKYIELKRYNNLIQKKKCFIKIRIRMGDKIMKNKIISIRDKNSKKSSELQFGGFLEKLYCLNDEINELNEIKSVILDSNICRFELDLSNYKVKNTNEIMFQKVIKDYEKNITDLKCEVVKLMHEANIIEKIMTEFELQWDKTFINNEEYLIKIYDEICPIGIAEYIERSKDEKASLYNE